MAHPNQLFDLQKAVAIILYIANRVPNPTLMSVMKLIYLADKTSLERYGRFMCDDVYVAMKHGPVPTRTYDLLKAGRDSDQYGFIVQKHDIRALKESDLDEMSDSDLACLDQIIAIYGNHPAWSLREISHDQAWQETWQEMGQQGNAEIDMRRIVALFDSAGDLSDFLNDRN